MINEGVIRDVQASSPVGFKLNSLKPYDFFLYEWTLLCKTSPEVEFGSKPRFISDMDNSSLSDWFILRCFVCIWAHYDVQDFIYAKDHAHNVYWFFQGAGWKILYLYWIQLSIRYDISILHLAYLRLLPEHDIEVILRESELPPIVPYWSSLEGIDIPTLYPIIEMITKIIKEHSFDFTWGLIKQKNREELSFSIPVLEASDHRFWQDSCLDSPVCDVRSKNTYWYEGFR